MESRFHLLSFCFFGFISQKWNPFRRREKSRRKLQSEKRGLPSTFLAPFFHSDEQLADQDNTLILNTCH
jgi:hypothetical protein